MYANKWTGHREGMKLPLQPQVTLQPFEKWAINFVRPIESWGKTGACYIIIVTEYLTRWVEAKLVKDCIATMVAKFLFENVLTKLGCPKILMSDQGTHFLNETISTLTEKFWYITKRARHTIRKQMGPLRHSTKFWKPRWLRSAMCDRMIGTCAFLLCYGHTEPRSKNWQATHRFG